MCARIRVCTEAENMAPQNKQQDLELRGNPVGSDVEQQRTEVVRVVAQRDEQNICFPLAFSADDFPTSLKRSMPHRTETFQHIKGSHFCFYFRARSDKFIAWDTDGNKETNLK